MLLALVCLLPARAARPLLDQHQWDAYFALFARDTSVPWTTTTIRLDTYSGAPVDFAAYQVDVADVIVAGRNRTPRAVDTAHLQPVVRWRFSPPAGYRFESSDVPVPLGSREGFFVVEARRGDAVQQVWLNRTHLGLVTKESPEGLVVWCVDLRSGHALANVDVSFLVGLNLIARRTDAHGTIVWREASRPAFVLAESGPARAFVSILPQAPLPATIVGMRVESAVARAGGRVRFVGFARTRSAAGYRRASGDVRVTLAERGTTLAAATAQLDSAGAFAGELEVPASLAAGDYALLANAGGGVAGTSLHVDAAADVALAVRSQCPCDPGADVALTVVATRGALPAAGVPVRVRVVRTPHVVPPGTSDDAPRWGTTEVLDRSDVTNAAGHARILIPAPTDGLDSTYGVRATTSGASATTRVVVPQARVALALVPDASTADVGQPVGFDVLGFDPGDGSAAPNLAVRVRLTHGASAQEQTVTLDARGRAHVVFKQPSLGSNLAVAETTVAGRTAADAAAVLVEPSALAGTTASADNAVALETDRGRYRPGDRVTVRASASGASGEALITLEGARTYQARVVPVAAGAAQASLDLGDAQGAVAVSAAFVRGGAIASGTLPLDVDAPGHARATTLVLGKSAYAPGEAMHVTIEDGAASGGATLAVRVADGRESGPALFDDAPQILNAGATAVQIPASDDPAWHAYVAPARSKASDIFAAERARKVATEPPVLGAAAPLTTYWHVARAEGTGLDVPAPGEPGRYVLSVLAIGDDGAVGAASATFDVR